MTYLLLNPGQSPGQAPPLAPFPQAPLSTFSNWPVSYNGNGSVGGAVPVDPNAYAAGASVPVLRNTGNLLKVGYVFTGWNTQANGGGTTYLPGAAFTFASNVTLYAMWTPLLYYQFASTPLGGRGAFRRNRSRFRVYAKDREAEEREKK